MSIEEDINYINANSMNIDNVCNSSPSMGVGE